MISQSQIVKNGNKSYTFKLGDESITFPTFTFLKNKNKKRVPKEEALLIKTIPGTNPQREYYDLFPDLTSTQIETLSMHFEVDKDMKREAISALSMFPEDRMNHFINLLELSNICMKGAFFITSGVSDLLMKSRENADKPKMGKELITCLDSDDTEFIVMYINLNLSGVWSLFKPIAYSHRNCLIIDKKNKKIIRFEPMGALPKVQNNITIAEIHQRIFEYLSAAKDPEINKHIDYLKTFDYFDTNKFDIYSCPFISAPQLGNTFCQTYSVYGALLYIINNEVFNKAPSSLFVALGNTSKIMLMWLLTLSKVVKRDVSHKKSVSSSSSNESSGSNISNKSNKIKTNKAKINKQIKNDIAEALMNSNTKVNKITTKKNSKKLNKSINKKN